MHNDLEQQRLRRRDETARIRKSLGLPPVVLPEETQQQQQGDRRQQRRDEKLKGAVEYCQEQLGDAVHRLFGAQLSRATDNEAEEEDKEEVDEKKDETRGYVSVCKDPDEILSKRLRGRREQIVQEEIGRLVDEYLKSFEETKSDSNNENAKDDDDETSNTAADDRPAAAAEQDPDRSWIHKKTVDKLFRNALYETSLRHGTRSDGRRGTGEGQGWKTIRPIQAAVPALPPSVHGSALFSRGDTQVLCTATLGAPSDGQPRTDPFRPTRNSLGVPGGAEEDKEDEDTTTTSLEKLPVGSLRFLRTQEALESDLNSRNVKADKETNGRIGQFCRSQTCLSAVRLSGLRHGRSTDTGWPGSTRHWSRCPGGTRHLADLARARCLSLFDSNDQ